MKIGGEEIEQVNNFKYLGSVIRDDMYCSTEIKKRIAMAKQGFKRKHKLLCGPVNKDLR